MTYSQQARMETIRRWLEFFTDEQILADQALTLTAGWIGSMLGEERGERLWTSTAVRESLGEGTWPGSKVPLRAMQAGLKAALGREGAAAMLVDAQRAAELSEGADLVELAAMHAVLGVAQWLAGDDAAAVVSLGLAEDEGAAANVVAQLGALGNRALLLAGQGRWEEAEAVTGEATRVVEQSGFSWGPAISVLIARSLVLAHRGDPAAGEAVAASEDLLARAQMPSWMSLLAVVILAEAEFQRGELEASRRLAGDASARLALWPDAGILRTRLELLRARLEQVRLAEPPTPAERRVLDLLPSELSLKEIARRLGVSRDTVKSHVADLYRKLDAHSRSQAVARARELKLLR